MNFIHSFIYHIYKSPPKVSFWEKLSLVHYGSMFGSNDFCQSFLVLNFSIFGLISDYYFGRLVSIEVFFSCFWLRRGDPVLFGRLYLVPDNPHSQISGSPLSSFKAQFKNYISVMTSCVVSTPAVALFKILKGIASYWLLHYIPVISFSFCLGMETYAEYMQK